ncbi:hypothetical protein RB597_009121 [Gaeumannomyces tritici]
MSRASSSDASPSCSHAPAAQRYFVKTLFAPGSAGQLARLSSHGLLGFSAAEGGDLEKDWRLVVLSRLSAQGVEHTAQLRPAAAGMPSLPEWFAALEYVVVLGLAELPNSVTAPSGGGGDDAWGLGSLLSPSKIGLKRETAEAIKKLSDTDEDRDQQAAFVASRVGEILNVNEQACQTMHMMVVAGVEVDPDRWASLLGQLWEMTRLMSEAFRSSEYLMNAHRTQMYAHYGIGGGAAAVWQLVAGGVAAVSRAALASAGTGFLVSMYQLRCGFVEKERHDYYGRLLHLLHHMWKAASELNTFLPRIRVAGDGTPEFRPGGQQLWELYTSNEVETAPAAVKYLKFRLQELELLRLRIEPLPPGTAGVL